MVNVPVHHKQSLVDSNVGFALRGDWTSDKDKAAMDAVRYQPRTELCSSRRLTWYSRQRSKGLHGSTVICRLRYIIDDV